MSLRDHIEQALPGWNRRYPSLFGTVRSTASGYTVAALVGFFGLAATAMPAWGVQAGDEAPPWVGTDAEDRQVAFPEVLQGQPAVIVFWASWCPHCRSFMPYLDSILDDYSYRGVQVIAINTREDESDGDPRAYLADLGFPLMGIFEGDAIAALYDVHFIPGLMVVDGTGTVSWRGESTDLPAGQVLAEQWSAQVRAALDAALASASSQPALPRSP